MRFRIMGYGGGLPEPIILYLTAGALEAAFLGGLSLLHQIPECDRVEISGPAHEVHIIQRPFEAV